MRYTYCAQYMDDIARAKCQNKMKRNNKKIKIINKNEKKKNI